MADELEVIWKEAVRT